jgi:hypothetical protein
MEFSLVFYVTDMYLPCSVKLATRSSVEQQCLCLLGFTDPAGAVHALYLVLLTVSPCSSLLLPATQETPITVLSLAFPAFLYL